jgi:hypothetical protein
LRIERVAAATVWPCEGAWSAGLANC